MKDLTGFKNGKVTFEKPTNQRNNQGSVIWQCRCDCGEILYKSARKPDPKCQMKGCEKCRKIKKYSDEDYRLYRVWCSIKERCADKKYLRYAGRGISICDEWKNDFFKFKEWSLKNGYKEDILPSGVNKLTIDRINNDGNYEPSNCRWVDNSVQNCNKITNHYITINGKTQCVVEWLKELNVKKSVFYDRIRRGWDDERAMTTPPLKENKNPNPYFKVKYCSN